jgi:osmotically-inducible protein OsmY
MKSVWLMMALSGTAVVQADEGQQDLRQIELHLRHVMPLESAGIEVAWRDDVVVLEGIAATLQDKQRAFTIAQNVSGSMVRNELLIGNPYSADGF